MGDRVELRRANREDLPAIVALLRDDALGGAREGTDLAPYEAAFAEIDGDPHHLLMVGELAGEVVACVQATLLPCLTHGGRRRAQLEGVRVREALRGRGVGGDLLAWCISWARDNGCGVVQLTTDTRRADARRFYEAAGFVATHDGLKLELVDRG